MKFFPFEKGDTEFEKDITFGTGEALKVLNGGGNSNNRRKRSVVGENVVLRSILRAKRQAESDVELTGSEIEQKEHSMLHRMKEKLHHFIEVAEELLKKAQQMVMGETEAQ